MVFGIPSLVGLCSHHFKPSIDHKINANIDRKCKILEDVSKPTNSRSKSKIWLPPSFSFLARSGEEPSLPPSPPPVRLSRVSEPMRRELLPPPATKHKPRCRHHTPLILVSSYHHWGSIQSHNVCFLFQWGLNFRGILSSCFATFRM